MGNSFTINGDEIFQSIDSSGLVTSRSNAQVARVHQAGWWTAYLCDQSLSALKPALIKATHAYLSLSSMHLQTTNTHTHTQTSCSSNELKWEAPQWHGGWRCHTAAPSTVGFQLGTSVVCHASLSPMFLSSLSKAEGQKIFYNKRAKMTRILNERDIDRLSTWSMRQENKMVIVVVKLWLVDFLIF